MPRKASRPTLAPARHLIYRCLSGDLIQKEASLAAVLTSEQEKAQAFMQQAKGRTAELLSDEDAKLRRRYFLVVLEMSVSSIQTSCCSHATDAIRCNRVRRGGGGV